MSDDISATYRSLKSRFERLKDDANMDSVSRQIKSMGEDIRELPEKIKDLRRRGYVFADYLENKAEVLEKRWEDIRERVNTAVENEIEQLRAVYADIERDVDKAEKVEDNPDKLEKVISHLEGNIDDLEDKARDAASRVREIFSTLQSDISQTESQLSKFSWYCDQKEEASFDFLANENLFLAADAEWVVSGKGRQDPDGIIFLTDQRLIFEQKEKTGKRLGMFGGKMEQEVEWEIPLHQVEEIRAENKGMFGGKDMIYLTLGSGAPYRDITVEVKGGVDCKFWRKQVDRMIAGETDDERAIEPDPEMVERLREAPTECHVCGATLPMLVANQTQIACEYCGAVVRI